MTAQVRFGLLGPLEVRAPAGLVQLRAGKHRVILAALLLQPNRPLSIDELIDPLTTTRWRWSSSDRPQSFEMSNGSTGELKKFSPTSFIDFEYV